MTLWLHVHCGYPSYLQSGEDWGNADYKAWKLIKLLKGKPINGYVRLQKADGTWVSITNANREQAHDLFGQWGAKKLKQLGIQEALLVPVPASGCVAFGTDPKGEALAAAIAKHHAGCQAVSALHWSEPLQKASEGGTRDAGALLDKLWLWTDLPKNKQVVILDDVASTGGHLLACARGLRNYGHKVEHALCAAQTQNTHPENMFAIPSRDLEEDPFAGLFD